MTLTMNSNIKSIRYEKITVLLILRFHCLKNMRFLDFFIINKEMKKSRLKNSVINLTTLVILYFN